MKLIYGPPYTAIDPYDSNVVIGHCPFVCWLDSWKPERLEPSVPEGGGVIEIDDTSNAELCNRLLVLPEDFYIQAGELYER